MRWLNAISILTLVLSIGTLVMTAAGTGNAKPDGAPPPPSSPIIIDADGHEAAPLAAAVGDGEVGVMLFGEEATPPPPEPKKPPVSAKPKAPPSKKKKPSASKPPVLTGCININTADEPALTALKGIGPATAAKIVEYRTSTGPYKKKEDIMKVKGIGPAKFAAIEPHICL